jgi:hypothetical protein
MSRMCQLPTCPGLQEDPHRDRWYYLMMPALNFTHKMFCAVLFGSLGLALISPTQLASLCVWQVRGKCKCKCTHQLHAHAHAAHTHYRQKWHAGHSHSNHVPTGTHDRVSSYRATVS